jgi:hypothetical protein
VEDAAEPEKGYVSRTGDSVGFATLRCPRIRLEQQWLASRLREAAEGWVSVAEPLAVVVVREVLGASTTDEEVRAALRGVPNWLIGEQNTAEEQVRRQTL